MSTFLDILQYTGWGFLWLVVGLAALLLIDAVFLRSEFLRSSMYTENYSGIGDGTLISAIPGILATHTSIDPLRGTLLDFGDVRSVGYEKSRFDACAMARAIAHDLTGLPYKRVVFVLTSMGGLLGLDVIAQLRRAGVLPAEVGCVFVDAISGSTNMGMGGNIGAPAMRALPFGPIYNVLGAPIMKMMLVPPEDDAIEEGLDKTAVKRAAIKSMSGYPLSMWRDQLAYMAAHKPLSPSMFDGIDWAVYLRCDSDNVTINQPAEADLWQAAMEAAGISHEIIGVESPHAAYAQLPTKWNDAIADVLRRYVPDAQA